MQELYVFGDQTGNFQTFFAKALPVKGHALLHNFLERASQAIRAESQNRSGRSAVTTSSATVQELAERYYGDKFKDPAIESALACIAQLAHFIGYVCLNSKSKKRILTLIEHNIRAD